MLKQKRLSLHKRVRLRILGTSKRPRLSVFRSGQHIFVQIIDDSNAKTLMAANDFGIKGTKTERAFEVGKKIAKLALSKKISEIIFDRGGFLYHGRVAKLAEGAREGRLKF